MWIFAIRQRTTSSRLKSFCVGYSTPKKIHLTKFECEPCSLCLNRKKTPRQAMQLTIIFAEASVKQQSWCTHTTLYIQVSFDLIFDDFFKEFQHCTSQLQWRIFWNIFFLYIGLLPSAVDSGGFVRAEDGTLKPVMSTKEPVNDNMLGGVTCNCKTECISRKCRCFDSGNKCTVLCHKSLKYQSERCRNC